MTRRVERAAGGILVDGQQVAETLQCCHCGMHWERQPGSGTQRGYCLKCNAVLCGKAVCLSECKPIEKWLDEQALIGLEQERQLQRVQEQLAEGLVIVRN